MHAVSFRGPRKPKCPRRSLASQIGEKHFSKRKITDRYLWVFERELFSLNVRRKPFLIREFSHRHQSFFPAFLVRVHKQGAHLRLQPGLTSLSGEIRGIASCPSRPASGKRQTRTPLRSHAGCCTGLIAFKSAETTDPPPPPRGPNLRWQRTEENSKGPWTFKSNLFICMFVQSIPIFCFSLAISP